MTSKKQIQIIIIEPSPVIREGLKVLLEKPPELAVCEMYDDFHDFENKKPKQTPDVVLINPAIVSFYKEFFIKTLFPDYNQTVFVAILYSYVDSETLNKFDGTLDIYDNGLAITKKLRTIIKTNRSRTPSDSNENAELSEREKEILASVAKGLTNKEIATKHYISIHTVVSHRKNIAHKIGIKTVSGLTMYAVLNNIISQDDLF